MPHLIDTHCHLDDKVYEKDLEVVVKQALADDIWIVTVGSDYASSVRAVNIAERYPSGVYAAVGFHPRKVSQGKIEEDKLMDLEKFFQLANHPKVVAIGETGLDFHHLPDIRSKQDRQRAEQTKENQKKVLSRFLQLSSELRLPLLLHCREAHDEMLSMLGRWDRTSRSADVRGIIHHFSGGWKAAKRYFGLDFMISATGLMTYGAHQSDVFRKAPLDRIVLESDCPHLCAVPWSHRRCQPTYLETVAISLAGLRRVSLEQVSRVTTENALKVLTKLA
jgi:TatD DNase family protein